MDELAKQVRRAHRRLALKRLVGVLGWCWFAALALALGLVIADKYFPLGLPAWGWAVGALGSGLLAATLWTALTMRRPLEAAIEIDRRFELKERVSSALAMSPEDLQTEAGQALLDDARHRVSRVDVPSKFAISPGRSILLPLAPGVLILLVAVLVSPAAVDPPAAEKTAKAGIEQPGKKPAESLRRQIQERRKQAEKQGLKNAELLFKKLEEGSRDLANDPADRKQQLLKLNDLTRQLHERREQLGGAEKVKQQLAQLNNMQDGPADRFAKALGKGDFKNAIEELKRLQEQLAQGKLNDEQREKLGRQMDEMKEKLQRLAQAHEAAKNDLQNRVNQARQSGQLAEADKLEQQLDKLLQQLPQMDRLKDLGEKLGQCSKCLREGQTKDAAGMLSDLQSDVNNLREQLDELEMLDGALDQLAETRDQMNCAQCGGKGCPACQGAGMGAGEGEGEGDGLGRGQGKGLRPEQKTDTAFYDSQVKQKLGKGSAVVVDMVDGPNVKGNVQTEIQQQVDSARRGSADPLTGHQLPRTHRQHAREYFDSFREGKQE